MRFRVPTRRRFEYGKVCLRRSLNHFGEVLVKPGQSVLSDSPVIRSSIVDNFVVVDVAQVLNMPVHSSASSLNIYPYLCKSENDHVEAGETLAEMSSFIKVIRRRCISPVSGKIIAIEGGWLVIEVAKIMEEVEAVSYTHLRAHETS